MKRATSLLFTLVVFLLVACQDGGAEVTAVPDTTAAAEETGAEEISTEPTEEPEAPEPTVAPTEMPTEEPTAEPTAEPADDSESEPTPETAEIEAESPDSAFPPAEIANDQGGPEVIVGALEYASYAVAEYFQQSIVGLMDATYLIEGNFSEFVPPEDQILGTMTSPITPSPASYRVLLPIRPPGASTDVDNDGQQDSGIQVFAAAIAPNFYGDITFDPPEQDWFHSYLTDPLDGTVREGSFLLYAADEAQGFPAAAGEDGVYFTADDPIVGLPSGYTVATLSRDGLVTFDRSSEATIDLLEPPSVASPDFSDQGILESYNSLIDVLAERYSYTELRELDWEAIRESHLPAVQRADEEEDLLAYFAMLNEMAVSIQDAHVVATAPSPIQSAYFTETGETVAANLGAQLVELDDGRFIITFLDPEGPGAQEGWQFGTEIISVDGLPTSEYVDSLPVYFSLGTPEGVRLSRLSNALRYPQGSTTTIEYILPGQSEVRSATLTPEIGFAITPPSTIDDQEISFRKLESGEGYIRWDAFNNLRYKVTVLEHALEELQNTPGMVLDLRGNAGGNSGLLFAMASYFFTAEKPAIRHWLDWYEYDETVGDLVKEFSTDYVLSAPRPDLAYTRPLVILVDEESTSAGEYFPQYLQTVGRATIVGEHSTAGAGGPIDRISLPGGLSFQFTKGRTVFAGTDELNLEGNGIALDVEVPITEENERAKLEGRDVVLEAGLEALAQQGVDAIANTTWQWTSLGDLSGNLQEVDDPALYTITINEDGTVAIQADCNLVNGTYSLDPTQASQALEEATIPGAPLTIDLGPATTAACEDGSRGEEFLQLLSTAFYFQVIDNQLAVLSGYDPNSFRFSVLAFEEA